MDTIDERRYLMPLQRQRSRARIGSLAVAKSCCLLGKFGYDLKNSDFSEENWK
jgi:hypothetical protein